LGAFQRYDRARRTIANNPKIRESGRGRDRGECSGSNQHPYDKLLSILKGV
jgi:hypothetical protein